LEFHNIVSITPMERRIELKMLVIYENYPPGRLSVCVRGDRKGFERTRKGIKKKMASMSVDNSMLTPKENDPLIKIND
jgi:hypothetical protein